MSDIYNVLDEELHLIEKQLLELFKQWQITAGIERAHYCGYDDDLFDLDIVSGLRIYFSNHDANLVIPFDVFNEIQKIIGDNYIAYMTQTGCAFSKPLYLYIYIEANEEYMRKLL